MAGSPSLSVVMVARNAVDGIPDALESLRAQTFTDYELVIVDDASKDHTPDLLKKTRWPRMRIHRNTEPKGEAASLNTAIKLAQAEIVAFHRPWDTSAPDRFEKQMAVLTRRKDVAAVGSDVDLVDREGSPLIQHTCPTQSQRIAEMLFESNCYQLGAVMARKEAVEEVGGFREALKLGADYDLWFRLAESYKLANSPSPLYRVTFSSQMPEVAHHAQVEAYTALARRLAEERDTHGEEKTDLEQAAASISAHFEGMGPVTRRKQQAANYLHWARRLQAEGPHNDRYVQALIARARAAWPFIQVD
jgi:glycosyltransferase involved in cell wall biosynthesis